MSGEGLMRGMRLKWEIYRWSVVMGKLLKSIWTEQVSLLDLNRTVRVNAAVSSEETYA